MDEDATNDRYQYFVQYNNQIEPSLSFAGNRAVLRLPRRKKMPKNLLIQLAQERALAYVAYTRASRALYIVEGVENA